tara:strand:- start:771 stop:1376 length:606 start_codon:yes stop_codon:yes gene_type:complete
MAGYNKREVNATMVNPQAIRQRSAINSTSGFGLADDQLNNQQAMHLGIARSQSDLFPLFPELSDSIDVFLKAVEASSNPDFASKFSPATMKSFNEITEEPQDDAVQKDSPAIGLGPNLKVQSIDNVISGNIESIANISTNLEGKRGFGWNSEKHSSEKIGSYFKDNYNSNDEESIVIKGERIDTSSIDYEQSYAQTTSEEE